MFIIHIKLMNFDKYMVDTCNNYCYAVAVNASIIAEKYDEIPIGGTSTFISTLLSIITIH